MKRIIFFMLATAYTVDCLCVKGSKLDELNEELLVAKRNLAIAIQQQAERDNHLLEVAQDAKDLQALAADFLAGAPSVHNHSEEMGPTVDVSQRDEKISNVDKLDAELQNLKHDLAIAIQAQVERNNHLLDIANDAAELQDLAVEFASDAQDIRKNEGKIKAIKICIAIFGLVGVSLIGYFIYRLIKNRIFGHLGKRGFNENSTSFVDGLIIECAEHVGCES